MTRIDCCEPGCNLARSRDGAVCFPPHSRWLQRRAPKFAPVKPGHRERTPLRSRIRHAAFFESESSRPPDRESMNMWIPFYPPGNAEDRLHQPAGQSSARDLGAGCFTSFLLCWDSSEPVFPDAFSQLRSRPAAPGAASVSAPPSDAGPGESFGRIGPPLSAR